VFFLTGSSRVTWWASFKGRVITLSLNDRGSLSLSFIALRAMTSAAAAWTLKPYREANVVRPMMEV
jgi:hypothetical protein